MSWSQKSTMWTQATSLHPSLPPCCPNLRSGSWLVTLAIQPWVTGVTETNKKTWDNHKSVDSSWSVWMNQLISIETWWLCVVCVAVICVCYIFHIWIYSFTLSHHLHRATSSASDTLQFLKPVISCHMILTSCVTVSVFKRRTRCMQQI